MHFGDFCSWIKIHQVVFITLGLKNALKFDFLANSLTFYELILHVLVLFNQTPVCQMKEFLFGGDLIQFFLYSMLDFKKLWHLVIYGTSGWSYLFKHGALFLVKKVLQALELAAASEAILAVTCKD